MAVVEAIDPEAPAEAVALPVRNNASARQSFVVSTNLPV
jgi:hypothetical protein